MKKSLLIIYGVVCLLFAMTATAQTPVISSTLSVSLTGDNNGNGRVNPGDQLSYSAVISNTGTGTATSVSLTMPAPANTTLVTGSLKTSALARPDSYTTLISGVLNGSSVLTNDFGLPAKSVLSFGPSGSPASVLVNGTNSASSDQGGTVVMQANGTFSYTPTGSFVGYDRFAYTATTTLPPNDATTVTIGVGTPVNAVANAYTITGNVTNTQSTTAAGLLGNDTGDQRVVTAINGNTANVGVAVTTAQSGTVTVAANGTFTYEPPAGYTGTDSFTYTANNGLNLPSTATVTLTIQDMIWFVNNTAPAGGIGTLARPFNTLAAFQAVNNGSGNNPAAGDNIFIYTGSGNYTGGLTLLANQKTFGQGMSMSLSIATGITPAPGSAAFPATNGTDPVITNSLILASNNTLRGFTIGGSSTTALVGNNFGTLTVNEVSINTSSAAVALNSGTLSGSGFETITSSGGGNNVSLSAVAGTMSINGGAMSGATGTAFNVNGGTVGITYTGNLTQSNNAALVSVSGGHSSGTINFQTGTLQATSGTGLQFDNADGTYNFNGTTTLNGGDAGVDIQNGSGGTFNFGSNASITNPTSSVISVSNSTANITYTGTFTKTSASTGINIQNNTGGTIAVNGTGTKVLSTQTGNAINLVNNTGAIISFGGNNLSITTTSGTGFNATGGGTVNVTGTGNTINASSGGTALNVTNTIIGTGGLTFQSISSIGGTTPGIILNNSGAGGLTVTGDGGGSNNNSGGTISNKTGAYIPPGAYATGGTHSGTPGVRLINASNVRLKYMNITGCNHSGIFGGAPGLNGDENGYVNSANGFQLVRCNITNNGDEINSNPDEAGVDMYNLTGTGIAGTNPTSIDNCTIQNNKEFEVQILNSSGTLTDFQMNNCIISSNNSNTTAAHGNLVTFAAYGTANMTLNVVGGSYTGNANPDGTTATGIQADHSGLSGTVTANISGATFTDNNVAVSVSNSNGGNLIFDINGNTATDNRSHGLNLFIAANATGSVNGKFRNNTVGTLNVASSGSDVGYGIRVQNEGSTPTANPVDVLITNNTVQETSNFSSINVTAGISAQVYTRSINLTITDNTLRKSAARAIVVQQSNNTNMTGSAGIVCANISGNNMSDIVGQAGDGTYIRLRQLAGGTFNVTQASQAALEIANTCTGGCTGKMAIGGTITYNQPACTQP